jgi:hypothetical protein
MIAGRNHSCNSGISKAGSSGYYPHGGEWHCTAVEVTPTMITTRKSRDTILGTCLALAGVLGFSVPCRASEPDARPLASLGRQSQSQAQAVRVAMRKLKPGMNARDAWLLLGGSPLCDCKGTSFMSWGIDEHHTLNVAYCNSLLEKAELRRGEFVVAVFLADKK